jgi:hypothetical protein
MFAVLYTPLIFDLHRVCYWHGWLWLWHVALVLAAGSCSAVRAMYVTSSHRIYVCVCVGGRRVIARCRGSINSLMGALVGNCAGVVCAYRYKFADFSSNTTSSYLRLDEVAARVGGVSDKCAFVSHWRQGLLLCLCLCVALATRSLCCAFSALIGGRGSIYIDHSTLSYKIGGLVVRLL